MGSAYYFPILWIVIAAVVVGVFTVTNLIDFFRKKIGEDPEMCTRCQTQLTFLGRMRWLLWGIAGAMTVGGAATYLLDFYEKKAELTAKRQELWPVFDKNKIHSAPDFFLAETENDHELIDYGRQIIANTQDFFGEKGTVRPASINGMNCQNCHLDAGSKPFGNNYFAVASTYPQKRARSGSLETIPKRVNDCFERSLNGQPIDTTGREMTAILAYLKWLGTGIPKGEKPKGTGLVEVPYLDRAADPERGKAIFSEKCASCHGTDGQGLPMPNSVRNYPPLWGEKSYNEGAGLFRMSRFAGYVKANMPLGASYQNPQLSDEEAWDVAAFVNSQPRPAHPFLKTDWPKIEKKPFDHPFGPFADPFSEAQHKFGPFGAIVDFYKK